MSTIPMQTPSALPKGPGASRRPVARLRLTGRGRRVLAGLAAAPLVGVLAFSALAGGSALASGESAPAVAFETVTVLPGDTLWSIAAQAAPHADPRDTIDEIKRLNNLRSTTIQVGTTIAIPTA